MKTKTRIKDLTNEQLDILVAEFDAWNENTSVPTDALVREIAEDGDNLFHLITAFLLAFREHIQRLNP